MRDFAQERRLEQVLERDEALLCLADRGAVVVVNPRVTHSTIRTAGAPDEVSSSEMRGLPPAIVTGQGLVFRAAGPRSQVSLGAHTNFHQLAEADGERSETHRVKLRALARRKLEHRLRGDRPWLQRRRS